MKKLISTILVGITLLSTAVFLFGCGGGGKPSDVSEEHYNYGLKALEILDSYLDYDLSTEEAYSQIEDLYKREDGLPDSEFEDPTNHKDNLVETYVYFAYHEIGLVKVDSGFASYGEIIEHRNEIAEAIGVKKR